MKDLILKSYVESFTSSEGYSELPFDECFERFVNYCVVSRQYPREFDIEALSVGGGDDTGFDGVAIVVNGNIVHSVEEFEYIRDRGNLLDVSFTFVQSKSSAKFKGDQVGTLIFGLKNFFDRSSAIRENDQVAALRSTKDAIYKKSIDFDQPPVLRVYFVTAGDWREPDHIVGRARRELQDLEEKRLFKSIELLFVDAEKLKETYREIRRKIVKEIDFPNHVALPEIPGVRQSFVGSLSAKEYLQLITDSDGSLQKNLFEDNVRDFQGGNKVNEEIGLTLKNSALQAALVILNNGITVIAKRVDPVGTKLKLTDFQVVNGCQSSHVLFANKNRLDAGTHIVLKVIETTDQDLSARVIRATNKQTQVTDEAFESLTPFHKELEEFYKAHSGISYPIYYERRSRQYDDASEVPASQVITLTAQIKTYVATNLAQPHSTHRYYGELLGANRARMFRPDDPKEPYFLACLAFNRLESLLRSEELAYAKVFRFQILYLMHCFHEQLKERKKGYGFSGILVHYSDKKNFAPVVREASKLVKNQLHKFAGGVQEAVRSKEFTTAIKSAFEREVIGQ